MVERLFEWDRDPYGEDAGITTSIDLEKVTSFCKDGREGCTTVWTGEETPWQVPMPYADFKAMLKAYQNQRSPAFLSSFIDSIIKASDVPKYEPCDHSETYMLEGDTRGSRLVCKKCHATISVFKG